MKKINRVSTSRKYLLCLMSNIINSLNYNKVENFIKSFKPNIFKELPLNFGVGLLVLILQRQYMKSPKAELALSMISFFWMDVNNKHWINHIEQSNKSYEDKNLDTFFNPTYNIMIHLCTFQHPKLHPNLEYFGVSWFQSSSDHYAGTLFIHIDRKNNT